MKRDLYKTLEKNRQRMESKTPVSKVLVASKIIRCPYNIWSMFQSEVKMKREGTKKSKLLGTETCIAKQTNNKLKKPILGALTEKYISGDKYQIWKQTPEKVLYIILSYKTKSQAYRQNGKNLTYKLQQ